MARLNLLHYLYFKIDEYLGFGTIYGIGPQPIDVLEGEALHTFCTEKDLEGDLSQFRKIVQTFDARPEAFFQMRRIAQDQLDFHQFFDLKEINKFIETGEIYI